VVAVCAVALGVGASSAPAYSDPFAPIDSPAFLNKLQQGLDGPGDTFIPPDWYSGDAFAAGEAAGRFPSIISSIGPIILAVGAFDLGWKIGRTIDTKWLHLSGQVGAKNLVGTIDQEGWCAVGGVCFSQAMGLYPDAGLTAGHDAVLTFHFAPSWTDCHTNTLSTSSPVTAPASSFSGAGAGCEATVISSITTSYTSEVGVTAGHMAQFANSSTECLSLKTQFGSRGDGTVTLSGPCFARVLTEPEINGALVHTPVVPFTTQTVGSTTTMSPAPPATMSSSDAQQARNCMEAGGAPYVATNGTVCYYDGGGLGGSVTWTGGAPVGGAHAGTPGQFNCWADPAEFVCPAAPTLPGGPATTTSPLPTPVISPPLTLPNILPGETLESYEARLRSDFFTGTIIVISDTMGYPSDADPLSAVQQLPGTVTRVTVGTPIPTVVPVYWPVGTGSGLDGKPEPWPVNPPVMNPVATAVPPITITVVPPTWTPPVPASGPLNPCNCGTVDFSPLTGLTYGTSFPFGVFAWVSDVTGGFSGGGAPISFTIADPRGDPYTVTLSSSAWEATYRPIVFAILEFCMTLAAIWFFAFRLIGFGQGEAAD
jgi:hypothetical protein